MSALHMPKYHMFHAKKKKKKKHSELDYHFIREKCDKWSSPY